MDLNNYFDLQERYYSYLHDKLGNKFTGEARKANGMVRTHSSIHCDGWDHLSSVESDVSFRDIALLCMEGKGVVLNIRNGECYMEAITTPETFPKMKIVKKVKGESYGNLPKNDVRNIWQCNEVVGIAAFGNGFAEGSVGKTNAIV